MKSQKTSVQFLAALAMALMLALPVMIRAEQAKSRPSANEEFFIISSVDPDKHHIVLKRPTEVTVLVSVDDQTKCVDEKGKPVNVKDLRAGDTVFVTTRQGKDGKLEAVHIRKGYMTLEEVHRRYLDRG